MDGLTLARTILENPKLVPPRIVLMTLAVHPPEAALLQSAGIAATVPKPLLLPQLKKQLQTILSVGAAEAKIAIF